MDLEIRDIDGYLGDTSRLPTFDEVKQMAQKFAAQELLQYEMEQEFNNILNDN